MDAGLRQQTSHFDEGEVADDDEYLDEDDSEGMTKTMTLRYHLLKAQRHSSKSNGRQPISRFRNNA